MVTAPAAGRIPRQRAQALRDPRGEGLWQEEGRAEGRGERRRGPDPEQLLRQVPALVDAPVHGHEALEARLVPHVGVVQAGVQHDHGEGQNVARVCGREQGGDDMGV